MASGNATARIYITADASGVGKAARDASRALDRLSKGAGVSFGRMTEVAGGFGLAMGAGGVLGVMKDSVSAYQASEASAARLSAQLATMGQNTDQVTSKINDAIQAQSEFGAFDDEDLTDAFTRIVRVTGDVNQALDLNNLAMDIARARNVDLATAADAVAKAAMGQSTAMKRMGVDVYKGMTATELLAAAQQKFAGQAQAYGESSAAAADRASIAWENAQEEIGSHLADAFSRGAVGAEKMAGSLNDVVSSLGGLKGIAIGGGLFAGIRNFGPQLQDAGTAASGFATQIGKIKQNAGWGAAIRASARTAGSSLSTLAGGPIGIAAIAAGGLAIGIAKAASEMTTMGEEANDVTQALQRLADAQLALKDAKFAVKQAQTDVSNAPYAVAEATKDYHDSIVAADTALRRFGEDSKQYAQAQDAVILSGQQLQSAQLLAEQATLRLEAALRQVDRANADVTQTAAGLKQQIGGVLDPSRKLGAQMTLDALHAGDFAAMSKQAGFQAIALADNLRKSATESDGLSDSVRVSTMQMADLIQTMGRVPTPPEIEFITNALAVGQSIDQIRQEIENIPKNTTVTINQVINRIGSWFTPPTSATGSAIAGRFDGKDNVPVMVSRGEVILNPTQIGMIGADRVYGALRATGAPTIYAGGGFSGGGSSKGPVSTMHGGPRRPPGWKHVLESEATAYTAAFNTLDARLAYAESTKTTADDAPARSAIRNLIKRRINQLRGEVRMVPARFRGDLYGEIASLTRSLDQYAPLSASDTGGGGQVDTSDLEARLAQAEARAAAATRNLGLSEAALGTFGGYGAGAGRAATVVQFHSIFPPTPDQYRVAGAFMSDAFGRQSYRRSPRIRIGA